VVAQSLRAEERRVRTGQSPEDPRIQLARVEAEPVSRTEELATVEMAAAAVAVEVEGHSGNCRSAVPDALL